MIDYKTGNLQNNAWFGERPDEPQLPLYCIQPTLSIAGIAFASIRHNQLQFIGIVDNKNTLPTPPH